MIRIPSLCVVVAGVSVFLGVPPFDPSALTGGSVSDGGPNAPVEARARERGDDLIQRMLKAIGGRNRLHQMHDVQCTYTYRNVTKGVEDVSLERYIFDGELSWARYDKHEVFVMPGADGPVMSFFDGEKTVSMHAGKVVEGEAAGPLAFLRKTNFYWFSMFFKLGDPGVNTRHIGTRTVDHIDYDIVEITFGDHVGDSPNDKYVLYVNPYTHLVDQFLFNVTAFGINDPLLMKVKYTMVDGTLLPVWRSYQPAVSWDSDALREGGDVVLELTENVTFRNGFKPADFALR